MALNNDTRCSDILYKSVSMELGVPWLVVMVEVVAGSDGDGRLVIVVRDGASHKCI